jgi:hypothetical protein
MLLVVVVDKTDTQGPADGHIISLHSPAKGGGEREGLAFGCQHQTTAPWMNELLDRLFIFFFFVIFI